MKRKLHEKQKRDNSKNKLLIPEQFTVKPTQIYLKGRGAKKLRNTFQRLPPEEFSSGYFGLRSFRQPEMISALAKISNL